MRGMVMAIRLFLAAVVVCAVIAALAVALGDTAQQWQYDAMNRWSGLLGMLIAGSAAPAAMGAVAPSWVLGHPPALLFAGLPLVVLLLIQLSDLASATMHLWALIGAICAALAVLTLPAAGFLVRRRERVA